jgi:hypothetical protein
MKQWITNQDGLENIKLVDAPAPDAAGLKEGEVLVKVNRVSLNYRDTEGELHLIQSCFSSESVIREVNVNFKPFQLSWACTGTTTP